MQIHASRLRQTAVAVGLASALLLMSACGEKSPQALAEGGKAALAQKDYKSAVVQLKTALQKEPQSVDLRVMLGEALLGSNDAPGAIVELNKAQEQKADADRVTPLLARALLRTGEFRKITQAYSSTILTSKEAQADLLCTVSLAWARQGDLAKANSTLDAALAAAPTFPTAVLMHARRLASAKNFDGAMAAVDQLLAKDPSQVDAWIFKGYVEAVSRRNYEATENAYRKAIEADKTAVGAHFALINLKLQLNDLQGAKNQAEALKTAVPKHPLSAYVDAQLSYAGGEFEKAKELTQQLMRGAPNNVGVLLLAGTVAVRSKELIQAETHFSKALQIDADLAPARLGLGRVYLQLGQPARALNAITPLLQDKSEDPDTFALAGDIQLALGDPTAAEALFSRASKLAPDDARVKTAIAMTQMARGNADAAFTELKEIAAASKSMVAEQAAYSARLRRREYSDALTVVDQMAVKQLDPATQSELRGRVYLAQRNMPKAREAFEAQAKAAPELYAAVSNLAALDLLEKKPDDARKRLRVAVESEPKNVYAVLDLATLQNSTNAPLDEVKQLLVKAIQIAPQMPEPRLALIGLTLRKRLYKEALVAAQEAAAALPTDKRVLDAVGRAQMEAGDVEQAVSTFRKMAGSSTDSGLPYTRLADIYRITGKKDLAESSLRKALEVEPGLVPAQVALVDLLVTGNRKSDALEFIKRLQRDAPNSPAGYSLEAVFHLRTGAADAAVQAYRAGVSKTRSSALAVALHRQLLRNKQPAEADRFAAVWQKDFPNDDAFAYQAAEAALGRNQFAEAETRFKQLLTRNPDNPLVLNNLAYMLILQGKDGAVAYAQKASDLAPENGSVLDTLAAALAADKQIDKALSTQKRAVEMAPDSGNLRLNLASLAIQAGDKALAKIELTRLKDMGAKFNRQEEVARLMKTL